MVQERARMVDASMMRSQEITLIELADTRLHRYPSVILTHFSPWSATKTSSKFYVFEFDLYLFD